MIKYCCSEFQGAKNGYVIKRYDKEWYVYNKEYDEGEYNPFEFCPWCGMKI